MNKKIIFALILGISLNLHSNLDTAKSYLNTAFKYYLLVSNPMSYGKSTIDFINIQKKIQEEFNEHPTTQLYYQLVGAQILSNTSLALTLGSSINLINSLFSKDLSYKGIIFNPIKNALIILITKNILEFACAQYKMNFQNSNNNQKQNHLSIEQKLKS